MDRGGAESAVITSAVLVAVIYAYRHYGESSADGFTVPRLAGVGQPVNLGVFIVAWSVVFLALAVMAEASPQLGGWAAILVLVGDVVTNGQQVAAQITHGQGAPATSPPASSSTGVDLSGIAGTVSSAASTKYGGFPTQQAANQYMQQHLSAD